MPSDKHYPHGFVVRTALGPQEIAEYEDDTGHLVLREALETAMPTADDEDDEDSFLEDFYAYCSTASLAEDLVEVLLERELGREPKDRHERAMRAERLLRRLHRITTGQDSADEQQLETAVGTLLMDLALWCHARDLCFDSLAETAEANACELAEAEHRAALKTLAAEIAAKTPLRAVRVTFSHDEDKGEYELEVKVDRDQVVASYPTGCDDLDAANDLRDALGAELQALGFVVYNGEADREAYRDEGLSYED